MLSDLIQLELKGSSSATADIATSLGSVFFFYLSVEPWGKLVP